MSHGKLLAIHVGRPAELKAGAKTVLSSIDKRPVEGPVMVRNLGIDGDEQADRKVHGGHTMAVYCYASEHYDAWSAELGRNLEFGSFGENLVLAGLLEEAVHIGDVLAIGETVLQVTRPRLPCFKLGAKFGDQRFVKRFLKSGRCGFYCRVLQEGLIADGQPVTIVQRAGLNLTVAQSFADAVKGA